MAKTFGGRKAAPFAKGGGRDTSHPNTAQGTPRKATPAKKPKGK